MCSSSSRRRCSLRERKPLQVVVIWVVIVVVVMVVVRKWRGEGTEGVVGGCGGEGEGTVVTSPPTLTPDLPCHRHG